MGSTADDPATQHPCDMHPNMRIGQENGGNGANLSQFQFPASTICFIETLTSGRGVYEHAASMDSNDQWGGQFGELMDDKYTPAPLRRHNGGANYAFIDGHVKWINSQSFGYASPCPDGGACCALINTNGHDSTGTIPTLCLFTTTCS